MKKLAIALVVLAPLALAGCASPSERADAIKVEKNPLVRARVGDMCRYRAIREGQGDPLVEVWTFRISSMSRGTAGVSVSVLGPPRDPASPSPREPNFFVRLPTADAGFSATELLRVFHRPDLTSEGMHVVLDRDGKKIEGTASAFPIAWEGSTREGCELEVRYQDDKVKGSYRIKMADGLPVLGMTEAELDEVWTSCAEDGSLHEERRHEKLVLVDYHDTTQTR